MPKILRKYRKGNKEYIHFEEGRGLLYNSWINLKEKEGFSFDGFQTQPGEYSLGKTVLLGAVFLPLALLGKSKAKTIVIMSRDL